MKGTTKAGLIIGAGLIVCGGLLYGIGAMGGGKEQLADKDIATGIKHWGIILDDSGLGDDTSSDVEITFDSSVAIYEGDYTNEAIAGNNIDKLEIEIGKGGLEIVVQDRDNYGVEVTDFAKFQYNVNGSTLYVRGKGRTNNEKNSRVILYIPEDAVFDDINLSVGAGTADLSELVAEKLKVSCGAGEIEIADSEFEQMVLEAGAGSIFVSGTMTEDLSIETGLGNIEYEGSVDGNIDAECAAGNVSLLLEGVSTDYDYDIECAAGNVEIGSSSYSGLGVEQNINNHAGKRIDIECAMGNVTVSFK